MTKSEIEKALRDLEAKTFRVFGERLGGDEVAAAYWALRDHPPKTGPEAFAARHRAIMDAIGVLMGSGERWNRTAKLLRGRGLARHEAGRWYATLPSDVADQPAEE